MTVNRGIQILFIHTQKNLLIFSFHHHIDEEKNKHSFFSSTGLFLLIDVLVLIFNKESKQESTEFSLKRSHANSKTFFFEDRRIQKKVEAFSSATPEINKKLFYCFEYKKTIFLYTVLIFFEMEII